MRKKKLYCYSLYQFKQLVEANQWNISIPKNVAVISILNSEKIALKDEIHVLPDSEQVLNLEFDDVSPEDNVKDVVLFDEKMAERSYQFIKHNIGAGRNFFIHCSAGVSRSQAFVKFIKDNWPGIYWETLKENPCRFPNFHVCHLLNEQYRLHNKTLNLILKGKWFDMIASGIKKEEYREIKPYWDKQIGKHINDFGFINFHRGYTNNTLLVECKNIYKGIGNTEWGAPENQEVYIIQLGNILNNDKQ